MRFPRHCLHFPKVLRIYAMKYEIGQEQAEFLNVFNIQRSNLRDTVQQS